MRVDVVVLCCVVLGVGWVDDNKNEKKEEGDQGKEGEEVGEI